MRYPDWSEQSTAGAVPIKNISSGRIFQNISLPGPGAPSGPGPPGWRAARSEVSVDLDVWQPGSQLPDGGPRDSLAVVTKHRDISRNLLDTGKSQVTKVTTTHVF